MKMLLTDVSVSYSDNETVLELKGRTRDFSQLSQLQGTEVEIEPAVRTSGYSQVITTSGPPRQWTVSTANDLETFRINPDGTMTREVLEHPEDNKESQEKQFAYKKSINACITWLLKHQYKKPIIIHKESEFLCGEQEAILAMDKDFTEYKGLYGIATETLVKNSKKFREQRIDRLFESIENY